MGVSGVVDRAISAVAPVWAARRMAARSALDQYQRIQNYRAADKNRLRSGWLPGGGSADEDLLPDLATLRERSRDMNRNDGYAAGATETVVNNTVGSGFRLQSRMDREMLSSAGFSEGEVEALQEQAERVWRRQTRHWDAQDAMDFSEIENLVFRQVMENGEIFVLPSMIPRGEAPWRPYSLALEFVEADRVESPPGADRETVRSGIELGERGQPLAYWIRDSHPGDYRFGSISTKHQRYAKRQANGRPQVLHLFWKRRPGQNRGRPFFAPVLDKFKDLADYMEAEVVAARVAACFAAFVTKEDSLGGRLANSTQESNQRLETLEPGIIEYLGAGEDVKFGAPNRPGGTFEPFVEGALREIAAGLGLPWQLVAKEFSDMNYSSARTALLEARRFFVAWQEWLAKKFHQVIYELLLEEAWLRGDFNVVDFYGLEEALVRARWIAPGWKWVDPTKEAQASQMAIDMGISTLADEAATQGRDWEEVLEQRAREISRARELGVPLGSEMTSTLQQNQDENDDEDAGNAT